MESAAETTDVEANVKTPVLIQICYVIHLPAHARTVLKGVQATQTVKMKMHIAFQMNAYAYPKTCTVGIMEPSARQMLIAQRANAVPTDIPTAFVRTIVVNQMAIHAQRDARPSPAIDTPMNAVAVIHIIQKQSLAGHKMKDATAPSSSFSLLRERVTY